MRDPTGGLICHFHETPVVTEPPPLNGIEVPWHTEKKALSPSKSALLLPFTSLKKLSGLIDEPALKP